MAIFLTGKKVEIQSPKPVVLRAVTKENIASCGISTSLRVRFGHTRLTENGRKGDPNFVAW
jgi:predicted phage tail protein